MSVTVSHGNLFSQLNDLAAGIRNNAAQAVKAATDAAYQDAKGTTLFKDRTGDMRGSIGESTDGLTGKVWRGRKKYFGFVANGTPPHPIFSHGIGASPLRFQINGRWVSTHMVNHPGTAPRPFMQHAYDRGAFVADMVGDRFINSAIQRFNRAS